MRICMLTYYYWPVQAGGAENQCRKLVANLVRQGHSCQVITAWQGTVDRCEEDNGATIVRMVIFETILQRLRILPARDAESREPDKQAEGSKDNSQSISSEQVGFVSSLAANVIRYCNIAIFSLNFLFFLFRQRRSIDILHVHTAEWISGLAAFAGSLYKIPVLCKGADMPVFPPLQAVPFSSFCDKWRRKPNFIALTQAMKENLIQNGVAEKFITVVPNGVILPSETAKVDQNSNFLYIGNFSQTAVHKGFDILIRAWAKVYKDRPEAHLVMLGGGNAKPWQEYAANLDCDKSIEFAGYHEDIVPFLKSSCCLLLPSRKEGISNALLEAQSWGLPAIVTDIPGNREVVLHDETGYIVAVDDVEALAKTILIVLDNPGLRNKLGLEASERIEREFSMEMVAEQVTKLYHRLLA